VQKNAVLLLVVVCHLSHSCIVLKAFDGCPCHLISILVGLVTHCVRQGPWPTREMWDLEVKSPSETCTCLLVRAVPKVSGLNILDSNIFHNLVISENVHSLPTHMHLQQIWCRCNLWCHITLRILTREKENMNEAIMEIYKQVLQHVHCTAITFTAQLW